jgi:hypothetical protein
LLKSSKASSTLLTTCALINGFFSFGDILVLSVALTSGVFLATGSFGASVDTCANGASVFVGSVFQGWTTNHLLLPISLILETVLLFAFCKEDKGCLTFSIPVSITHTFAQGAGDIGVFTCGSHSQGITVAFGAGNALAFKKLSRSFADFILFIFAISTICSQMFLWLLNLFSIFTIQLLNQLDSATFLPTSNDNAAGSVAACQATIQSVNHIELFHKLPFSFLISLSSINLYPCVSLFICFKLPNHICSAVSSCRSLTKLSRLVALADFSQAVISFQ